MSNIHLCVRDKITFCGFIENKIWIILVNGVVGEVHAYFFEVVCPWRNVGLCSEPY